MRYNHLSMLPENGFQKKLGSNRPATLEGGGGGGIGSAIGGIAGNMIAPGIGGAIGSSLGGMAGNALMGGGGQQGGGGGKRGGGGGGNGSPQSPYLSRHGGGPLLGQNEFNQNKSEANSAGQNLNLTAGMAPAPSALSGPEDQGLQYAGLNMLEDEYAAGGPVGHNPQFYSEGGLQHAEVKGGGDGTSDSVPAMLASGEFVIPADIVAALGNGSNDSGAKTLNKFLSTIRDHKQKHDPKDLPPDSKGPQAYLLDAKKKKAKK